MKYVKALVIVGVIPFLIPCISWLISRTWMDRQTLCVTGGIAFVCVILQSGKTPFWWIAHFALLCEAVCVQLWRSVGVFLRHFAEGAPGAMAELKQEVAQQ